MMSKEQKFGLQWELWALDQLLSRGWAARLVSNYYADVDIMIGNLPVEVKAAQARKHWAGGVLRTRWQFDVDRLPRWADSLVILIAVTQDKPYPFVIPSWLVGVDRHNVHITSHPKAYRGYFAQFLNGWGNVETALSIRAQYAGQMFLPLGTGDTMQLNQEWGQFFGSNGIEKPLSPSPLVTGA